jgi:hypothetical protein
MTWHNMNDLEMNSYLDTLYESDQGERYVLFETDDGLEIINLFSRYEECYLSRVSFEDFLKEVEPDIIEPNDYIDYLIENNLGRDAYADGFEFMEEVDYKTLESCDDYKRGYERMLYIYELDYDCFGISRPKKASERQYLGVTFTQYQYGDMKNFEISKYNQVTKRITVKEWQAA